MIKKLSNWFYANLLCFTLLSAPAFGASTIYEAESPSNTITGMAGIYPCSPCSGGADVGYLGNGSQLIFNGVASAGAGSMQVTIYYGNGSTSPLPVLVSSNGMTNTISLPSTGGWWTIKSITTSLPVKTGMNSISIGNSRGWVPDIDRAVIVTPSPPVPPPPPPPPPPSGPVVAFPGAQGSGAMTVGGRAGKLIEVTNLNDSGAGSLRAAIEYSGPRTVVFRVGGVIWLQTGLRIWDPFITIAGQTAPGGGIEVYGKQSCENVLHVYTHDVILRYLRLRAGSNDVCRPPGSQLGSILYLGNADVHDVIADHLSLSWTSDDTVAFWPNSGTNRNVTLQYILDGEGLAGHATCFIAGDGLGGTSNQTNIDVHHNYFTGCSHRIPLAKIASMRWVNNLTYNWSFYASQALGGIQADFINNYYKAGPLDPGYHEFQFSEVDSGDGPKGNPSIYLSGNIGPHNSSATADNWIMANRINGENGSETGAAPSSFKRSSPLPASTVPIRVDPASSVPNILSTVGASARLNCSGGMVTNRDPVDVRLVNYYSSGAGGIIQTEGDVGGMPNIDPGTACTDSDHDGIPDAWETAHGLNPKDASDANKVDPKTGYTYLEEYLAGQ